MFSAIGRQQLSSIKSCLSFSSSLSTARSPLLLNHSGRGIYTSTPTVQHHRTFSKKTKTSEAETREETIKSIVTGRGHPTKFLIPRKRASKLFNELQNEAVADSQAKNPAVHNTHFRVGDAVEITQVGAGGVNSTELEQVRGVVLGVRNRGLGTGFYMKDCLMGEAVEWKMALHSPLMKKLTVLESNFIYKNKRKVKRAKLFYLRDRNPTLCRVTKAK